MGWRTVIVSGRAKLDLKLNYLVVRKKDVRKIFLDEIKSLIIESTQVSLTAALISELSERKIKVIFCDNKHNPCCEIVNYYNKHNTSLMVKNQISWSDESKRIIWTKLVKMKIYQQYKVLNNNGINKADLLLKYIDEIRLGDATNREGHAAKVYFNSLFGTDFSRNADNPINNMLNYGYSIILSYFNRDVVANGYITQIGIFHDNQFNQFNLSCDLMEPFRPLIDRIVINYYPEKFGKEEKREVLNSLDGNIINIEGRNFTLYNGISYFSKSVFEALEKSDENIIKEIEYEL